MRGHECGGHVHRTGELGLVTREEILWHLESIDLIINHPGADWCRGILEKRMED